MKLAIISHTEHYQDVNGNIVGWGPTISEINHLAADFDEIYHIAFLHPEAPPPSSLPYIKKNIHFVPLKPVGGKGLGDKLKIVTHTPGMLKTVRETLKKVDVFQFRAPTGIGVVLIPYLTWFNNKKGWFKYAGNWNQKNPPLGYRLQRWMLKRQRRKVTINGRWPEQPEHCLTFENPCLTEAERQEGLQLVEKKSFQPPFTFCFVGRLEDAKGVQRIIDAFGGLNSLEKVAAIHFIGNGDKMETYKKQAKALNLPTHFHGFLERDKVFEIYKQSHFFLLPSTASEGFPKVIAEAMNFGCLPIVSSVSSIGQYVNNDNGFIVNPCTSKQLLVLLNATMDIEEVFLKNMAIAAHQTVFQFTFKQYRKRIKNEAID
ncbi:glycosyltransferase [Aequorivita marina]|uniref:glycosyltransferase n=1 Tax=Aequorivita marina TaxID=3073654 RepID=UPI002874695A|nr:glycosyltransferase [Aequorivita sp. S2608]MDS1298030.1 glycosyltransferase [Aequorivita sp. S2608]